MSDDAPRTAKGSWVAWHIVALLELGACVWLTLQPLLVAGGLHAPLSIRGLLSEYNIGLSNMDVLALAISKALLILALVLVAPMVTKQGRVAGSPPSLLHVRLRTCVRLTCTAAQLLLLAKASMVAVLAPDGVWPVPADGKELGSKPFVGLAAMFGSIAAVLLASFIQSPVATHIVRVREAAAAASAAGEVDAEAAEPLLATPADLEGGADAAGRGVLAKPSPQSVGLAPEKPDKRAGAKDVQRTIVQLVSMSIPDAHINAGAFLAGGIAALGSALVPYYMGLIVDHASIEPDRALFVQTIWTLVWVSAGTGVFTGIRGGLFTLSSARLNLRLRRQLFAALMSLDMGFFDATPTGDISSRLASDTNSASDQISLCMNVAMRSSMQALLVLMFMLYASWRLTTITFILIPLIMAISKIYGNYYSIMIKKTRTELAEANAVAEQVLGTMSTVKAHAAQASSQAFYSQKLDAYFTLSCSTSVAYALYAAVNTFLPNAVSALVLFYGGSLVLQGHMSPGALVSFMLYQQSLSSAFQAMSDVFSGLMAAVGAADKVLELIHRQPAVSDKGTLVPAGGLQGRIELRDIVFHYPTRPDAPVLRGLTFLAAPGEVIALVGPSGGGKSSIVKLVERFYLPASGQVLLDDRDVGVYNNKWLRRQVAMVSQEPILYARSIRRNIVYGLEEEDGCTPPSQAEVEEAAKQANAHDFVTGFPNGYETNCGEKGAQMSGGQKQRIAIARALVRRPRVLLLDEATSALDADSEAVVQEALDRMMGGRTTLVIAHRLSTVQHADKIVVVAGGRVMEVGTHDELLAKGGSYAALVRRQLTRPTSSTALSRKLSLQALDSPRGE